MSVDSHSRILSYRWVTSWFVHVGFQHVLSNSLLFAMVAYQLEEKYGCWRITLLWALSALGGTFTSDCRFVIVVLSCPQA